MGGHETGGLEQNWGAVLLPRPGPKTASARRHGIEMSNLNESKWNFVHLNC